jgi:4-phytase / acid phosphatase
MKKLARWLAVAGALLAPALASAQTVSATPDDTVLRQIILFGRHGVRSPVAPAAALARFTARAYPDFGVPPGYLTPHGAQAATLLGSYFHEYLVHEGLLSGDAAQDAKSAYFRANSIQRSNVTAAALAAGLYPGATVPVHSYPLGQPDPIFDPIAAQVAKVDAGRASREVAAIFGTGPAIAAAYGPEFSLIRQLVNAGPPQPPASPPMDATQLPIPLAPNTSGVATGNVINSGAVAATLFVADPFVMEYTDGLPLKDVAWGDLTLEKLSQQTRIITLYFDLEVRAPYLSRVQSSNAAAHVLRSLQQAATGKRVPGAFGEPGTRVLVVNSSDAYVAGLAGLLRMHWLLPGFQPDYCAPDGALVFELRQSRSTGKFLVRVFYTAQTFDQLRDLTPLSLDQPPATAQLFVPGSHPGTASLDVPFAEFKALVESAVDRGAVQDPRKEQAPGALLDVPLS